MCVQSRVDRTEEECNFGQAWHSLGQEEGFAMARQLMIYWLVTWICPPPLRSIVKGSKGTFSVAKGGGNVWTAVEEF